MSAYSLALRRLVFPAASLRAGNGFAREYELLRRSQWWPREKLRRLQTERLQRILAHACERVPFYRTWMGDHHLEPKNFREQDDLQLLPVLTKSIIRAQSPDAMLAADIPASRRIPYSTSGSTGVPFQFWVSRALNGSKIARYLREMSAWGIEPGTPFLKVWGAGRVPAPGRETEQAFFTQRLLRRREALAFDLDEEKALLLLEALREGRLKVLEAYASTALFLARIAKVKGLSFPQLKAVVVSGETLAHGQAQFLAETFGARVVNAYGSREFGRVAFSCPEGDGLFFSMECFFAEYLDLDPPDPSGLKRLVLTCFSNETQPFIRYDTGDLVEPDDPGTTLGGRGLEVWKRVEGRLAERVVTPAGRQLSVHYFTLLFEDLQDAVRQFQVVADQPGHLSLWIVPGPSFDETLGKNLCARILEHAGPGMSVDIKTMGAIPVSGDGKRPLLRNLA